MTKILTTLFFTFLITYYNRRTGCGAKLRPHLTYQMIEIEIHWFNDPSFKISLNDFELSPINLWYLLSLVAQQQTYGKS
jgi:hypothetical protein